MAYGYNRYGHALVCVSHTINTVYCVLSLRAFAVRIDAKTGLVDALYDISVLAKLSVHANTTAGTDINPLDVVANGIAFDTLSLGSRTGPFIVTGKLWSHYYRVHLSDPKDMDELSPPDRLWLAIMLSLMPVIVLIIFMACP